MQKTLVLILINIHVALRSYSGCSEWKVGRLSDVVLDEFPRNGGVAKWLCSGLQSRLRRFDPDPRLQFIVSDLKLSPPCSGLFFCLNRRLSRKILSLDPFG